MRRRALFRSPPAVMLALLCLGTSTAAIAGPGAARGALAEAPAQAPAPAPAPGSAATYPTNYTLQSVACVTKSSCTAVGYGGSTVFNEVALAEHWNGRKWRSVPIPPATGDPSNYLFGVACVSSSFCWAVGDSASAEPIDYTSLTELWNGNKWAVASSPSPSNVVGLLGVACITMGDCWAVGSYTDGYGARATYAERWSETDEGSHWAEATVPIPTGATASSLSSVACEGSRNCTAVGYYKNSKGVAVSLVEHFNGSLWTVTSTPNPAAAMGSYLYGVTCTSSSSCTAVGYYETRSYAYDTLAEHWNGKAWKLVSTPNHKGVSSSFLNSITCSSSTSCMAMGYWGSAEGDYTLAEQLKGTSWKIIGSPNHSGSTGSFLTAAACTSAVSCSAVGYDVNTTGNLTLGEKWNGSAWAIVSTPSVESPEIRGRR